MKKIWFLLIAVLLIINPVFVYSSEDENKFFESMVSSSWEYYQKILQSYSVWKNGEEIELENVYKTWFQSGLNQAATNILDAIKDLKKQDIMKYLFPKDSNYNLRLIIDLTGEPIKIVASPSTIEIAVIKKAFNSKVEFVDRYSERISGGLFNLDSTRNDSLKSFYKKNINKENTCSISLLIPLLKKSDFVKKPDNRWQLNLHDSITVKCPFAEREKTFEKTIHLIMPYNFQPDLSKVDDNKYIDVRNFTEPANTILHFQLLDEALQWLKKEMKFKGINLE